ncbi:MAG: acetylornithine transaminase [Candidatus Rokubacteria bacterium]|nr:acetylornithine transaminase [Candidatus Rokubacteria bacterium]
MMTPAAAADTTHDFSALMEITARPDVVFVRGEGSWLWDDRGRRYLDFVQGWAVNSLGHCPAPVRRALAAQAGALINPSPAFHNEAALRLARLLVAHSALDRVFFANSGAEANEGAIKLARKWGRARRAGAYKIVTMADSFHGRTLATMSASGKPGWDRLFAPQVDGFVKVPLNDLAALEAAVDGQTVAVMLEPIQGEAGVIPAHPAYLRAVRRLTRERGMLMILDEVQTGIGRTGRLFAYEHHGVEPDIMTLGKGIGAGAPLAALLAREEACCFEHGDQGGTFNGNALMAAVGTAVLETILAPGFLEEVRARGAHLEARLEATSRRFGLGEVRGQGLLLALGLGSAADGSRVVAEARAAGLHINAPRPDCLRFMPALNVAPAEIDQMIEMLEPAIARALEAGTRA